MGKTKKIKQAAQEELESLRKHTEEHVKKNFTAIPRVLIEQLFGADLKPITQTEAEKQKNFSELNIEEMKKQYEGIDTPEIQAVREQLDEMQEKQDEAEDKRRFDQYTEESKQVREKIKQQKQEKIQKEVEQEEEKKKKEHEKKEKERQAPIPQGKQQRGSLFARKKKKTVENRPAFGKH